MNSEPPGTGSSDCGTVDPRLQDTRLKLAAELPSWLLGSSAHDMAEGIGSLRYDGTVPVPPGDRNALELAWEYSLHMLVWCYQAELDGGSWAGVLLPSVLTAVRSLAIARRQADCEDQDLDG